MKNKPQRTNSKPSRRRSRRRALLSAMEDSCNVECLGIKGVPSNSNARKDGAGTLVKQGKEHLKSNNIEAYSKAYDCFNKAIKDNEFWLVLSLFRFSFRDKSERLILQQIQLIFALPFSKENHKALTKHLSGLLANSSIDMNLLNKKAVWIRHIIQRFQLDYKLALDFAPAKYFKPLILLFTYRQYFMYSPLRHKASPLITETPVEIFSLFFQVMTGLTLGEIGKLYTAVSNYYIDIRKTLLLNSLDEHMKKASLLPTKRSTMKRVFFFRNENKDNTQKILNNLPTAIQEITTFDALKNEVDKACLQAKEEKQMRGSGQHTSLHALLLTHKQRLDELIPQSDTSWAPSRIK